MMKKDTIYNIGIGSGCGLIQAIICIMLLSQIHFAYKSVQFIPIVIIGIALPFCTRFIQKWGFNSIFIRIVMIIVSYIICIIYGLFMQTNTMYDSQILQVVLIAMSIIHIASLIVNVGTYFVIEKKG